MRGGWVVCLNHLENSGLNLRRRICAKSLLNRMHIQDSDAFEPKVAYISVIRVIFVNLF
jgi:hypothetical protein